MSPVASLPDSQELFPGLQFTTPIIFLGGGLSPNIVPSSIEEKSCTNLIIEGNIQGVSKKRVNKDFKMFYASSFILMSYQ